MTFRPPRFVVNRASLTVATLTVAALVVVAALWHAGPLHRTVDTRWAHADAAQVVRADAARCPEGYVPVGGCAHLTVAVTVGTRPTVMVVAPVAAGVRPGDGVLVSRISPRVFVGYDRADVTLGGLYLAAVVLLAAVGFAAGLRALAVAVAALALMVLFAAPALLGGTAGTFPVAAATGVLVALAAGWAWRQPGAQCAAAALATVPAAAVVSVGSGLAHLTGSYPEVQPGMDLGVNGLPVGGMLAVAVAVLVGVVLAALPLDVSARRGWRSLLRRPRGPLGVWGMVLVAVPAACAVTAAPTFAFLTVTTVGSHAVAETGAFAQPVMTGTLALVALTTARLAAVTSHRALRTVPVSTPETATPPT